MFFPVQPYHVIDLADKKRQLEVVCEATSRREVSDYLRAHGLAKCDVFKESGEELYRGICEVKTIKVYADDLIERN